MQGSAKHTPSEARNGKLACLSSAAQESAKHTPSEARNGKLACLSSAVQGSAKRSMTTIRQAYSSGQEVYANTALAQGWEHVLQLTCLLQTVCKGGCCDSASASRANCLITPPFITPPLSVLMQTSWVCEATPLIFGAISTLTKAKKKTPNSLLNNCLVFFKLRLTHTRASLWWNSSLS